MVFFPVFLHSCSNRFCLVCKYIILWCRFAIVTCSAYPSILIVYAHSKLFSTNHADMVIGASGSSHQLRTNRQFCIGTYRRLLCFILCQFFFLSNEDANDFVPAPLAGDLHYVLHFARFIFNLFIFSYRLYKCDTAIFLDSAQWEYRKLLVFSPCIIVLTTFSASTDSIFLSHICLCYWAHAYELNAIRNNPIVMIWRSIVNKTGRFWPLGEKRLDSTDVYFLFCRISPMVIYSVFIKPVDGGFPSLEMEMQGR